MRACDHARNRRDLGKRLGYGTRVRFAKNSRRRGTEKNLPNVDLYRAVSPAGSPPQLNTPIFAVSRVAGWCAHVIEQHDHNRLIRPRSLYTGPELRPYPGSAGNGAK